MIDSGPRGIVDTESIGAPRMSVSPAQPLDLALTPVPTRGRDDVTLRRQELHSDELTPLAPSFAPQRHIALLLR